MVTVQATICCSVVYVEMSEEGQKPQRSTDSSCGGDFSLFLTLSFTSALCMLQLLSSLPLMDGLITALGRGDYRPDAPHIFATAPEPFTASRQAVRSYPKCYHCWTKIPLPVSNVLIRNVRKISKQFPIVLVHELCFLVSKKRMPKIILKILANGE